MLTQYQISGTARNLMHRSEISDCGHSPVQNPKKVPNFAFPALCQKDRDSDKAVVRGR